MISGFVSILLAEDSAGDVFLVRRALKQHGIDFDLNVVTDGQEAVQLLDRIDGDASVAPPNLVLLDLNLPRRDGAQILTRLRQSPKLAGTKVVILTSSDSARDRETLLDLGADEYFRKPTDLASFMKLGEVVRRILG